jgi:hypothetical protein
VHLTNDSCSSFAKKISIYFSLKNLFTDPTKLHSSRFPMESFLVAATFCSPAVSDDRRRAAQSWTQVRQSIKTTIEIRENTEFIYFQQTKPNMSEAELLRNKTQTACVVVRCIGFDEEKKRAKIVLWSRLVCHCDDNCQVGRMEKVGKAAALQKNNKISSEKFSVIFSGSCRSGSVFSWL